MNGCLADIMAWITSHVQIKLWSLIHAVFFNQVLLIVHKGGGAQSTICAKHDIDKVRQESYVY